MAVTSKMGTATYALDASTISLYFKPDSYATLAFVDYKLSEKITTPGRGEKSPTAPADTGLFGDINGDDVIDIADISQLLAAENYGLANSEYDLTGDGFITIDDIAEVLQDCNFGKSSVPIV